MQVKKLLMYTYIFSQIRIEMFLTCMTVDTCNQFEAKTCDFPVSITFLIKYIINCYKFFPTLYNLFVNIYFVNVFQP